MPRLLPSVDAVVDAAANVWDMSPLGSGLADRTTDRSVETCW
jgi:hypothetical protein